MATWKEYLESKGISIDSEMQEGVLNDKDFDQTDKGTSESSIKIGEESGSSFIKAAESMAKSVDELKEMIRDKALDGTDDVKVESVEEVINSIYEEGGF